MPHRSRWDIEHKFLLVVKILLTTFAIVGSFFDNSIISFSLANYFLYCPIYTNSVPDIFMGSVL